MRSVTFLLVLIFPVLAFPAGGVAQVVRNYEVPGNLAPQHDPGCIGLGVAEARLSPPDLSLAVRACLVAGDAHKAAEVFLLMLARGRFDSLRVADQTAHQAATVLKMELVASLSESGKRDLDVAIKAVIAQLDADSGPFCARLRATGVPGHDPAWMIAHGMAAVSGTSADPLVVGFNPAAAWKKVLTQNLPCR